MTIVTALSRLLSIRVPLFNAPMTPQAGGELARAVADAGAFGMLGFDEDESESAIAAQAALLRDGRDRAFGIGLAAWVLERRPSLLELAIAARPKLVSISFGDPSPFVGRLHAAGIPIASQVQSRKWAQTAIDAGVDVIVAQGTEAGGHTGSVGTLPLLQLVLEMTDRPVVAAGGIATGRGFAAALAAGAAGAWVGTPFLAARESRTTPQAQERLIASDETQTIYTHVYDVAQGKPWPQEFAGRALRNDFADRWHDRQSELRATPEALDEFAAAKAARDYSRANVYAGQSVGAVTGIRSAGDIVRTLERDAIARLAACASLLTAD
ncbi:MAG TPA: nitronate monooxygenase [Candidatus Tumulicola sp.]|jgi:nitronate monooxygenase